MKIIQSGLTFSFNYTAYDQSNSLHVAFNVYDVSGVSPVFITRVTSTYANFGSYMGTYVGSVNKTYLIIGVVYTDVGLTTPDMTRPASSDIFQATSNVVTYLGFAYSAYDYSSSLKIQAAVFNLETGSPVFVQDVNLVYVAFGVYFGSFTGNQDNTYNIASVVFTDNTYTTPDFSYSPSVEEFDCLVLGAGLQVLGRAQLIGQNLSAILRGDS